MVLRSALFPTVVDLIPKKLFKNVTHTMITEASATVKLPNNVFYNPVQEFNRDVTIAVIKNYIKLRIKEFTQKGINLAQKNNNKIPIKTDLPSISILEALSASGLRSVRFAKEIPFVSSITANDLDPSAVELITKNCELNNVLELVTPTCSDAISLMSSRTMYDQKYNVIDIDPYGSALPFLDSAVQCIYDGGLLCVTCTDMAVLCGSASGTSFGKYGGVAIKMQAAHEQGLRLLLNSIQQAASRYGKVIEPLLSLSVDFYARVFVRIRTSPLQVKQIASKIAIVYSCKGCQSFHLQKLGDSQNSTKPYTSSNGPPINTSCAECDSNFSIAGPMWADKIHNKNFIDDVIVSLRQLKMNQKLNEESFENVNSSSNLIDYKTEFEIPEWLNIPSTINSSLPCYTYGTIDRLIGMLTLASEELPDSPLYFQSDQLASIIRTLVPKMADLRSALINAGYNVSFSHAATSSLKTDAPMSFIWDIMCAWKHKVDKEKKQTKDPDLSPNAPINQIIKVPNKKHPPSEHSTRVQNTLINRPLNLRVNFSRHAQAEPPSQIEGLLRYQINPLPNWGPKARPAKTTSPPTEQLCNVKRIKEE